jgi:hypothetical protein
MGGRRDRSHQSGNLEREAPDSLHRAITLLASYIDNFRTPHSEKLHVVERFTIGKDQKSLSALVTVEDPDTFNGPITLTKRWFRVDLPIIETVCSENNSDFFNQNLFPIPEASKPDF